MPIVSSADAATLSVIDLVEALQNPISNAPFVTINDTHHTAMRSLAELFKIIPKDAEQQSTNRHNGQWRGVAFKPYQVSAPITHR